MSASVPPPDIGSTAQHAPAITGTGDSAAAGPRGERTAQTAFWVALTAALSSLSLWGGGGLELATTTHVQLAVTAFGVIAGLVATLAAGRRRWWGTGAALALGAYGALCAVSIIWSIEPNESWLEANRVFAWLAVFAGGLALARTVGRWWPAVLGAIVASSVIVSVWALLTKVFPEQLAADETYARLRAPYDYWNAVGLTAAFGILAAVWLGARRGGRGTLSALAVPAIGLLTVAMMLAYSRGSLFVLVLALALWFTAVPLRLRSAAVLLPGLAGGLLVTWWAFAQDTLTTDKLAASLRATSGGQLGIALIAITVVLLVCGVAIRFRADGAPMAAAARRRAGTLLLILVALIPIGVAGALTTSDRGLSGSISHAWDSLTDPADGSRVTNDPSRLTQVASVRAKYWDEAWKIFRSEPWTGTGAGSYVVARERVRSGTLIVRHAHGFGIQTASDLGLAGIAICTLFVAFWLWAADRTLGVRERLCALVRRRPRPPSGWSEERAGMAAMIVLVAAFGAHSMIDWTWYVPGNAVVALLCGGWVAGRGPWTEPASAPSLLARRLRAGVRSPLRVAGAALLLALAVVSAWSMWQPLASDRAVTRSQKLATEGGAKLVPALDEARSAQRSNPLSLQPLYAEAFVQTLAGRKQGARSALVDAVRLQPGNPDSWLQLADFTLHQLNEPQEALRLLGPALHLDPHSEQASLIYLEGLRIAAQQATEKRQKAEQAAAEKKRRARRQKKRR